MNKAFPIDFIRQIIEQSLEKEHNANLELFGGEEQVCLFSFYEQLVDSEEVDRYVERYSELDKQLNRDQIIMNGIIVAPENPTIINLYNCTIIPLSFTASFRLKLANRDLALATLNNFINLHKGKKVDIAEFDNGKLFVVGTVGNNDEYKIADGDFIGEKDENIALNTFVANKLNDYLNNGINTLSTIKYLYYEENGLLKVAYLSDGTWTEIIDDGNYEDVIFPPEHESFTKYKISMSFDSLRCDTPATLNGDKVISISFGGSATITNEKVLLGNDLIKVIVRKSYLNMPNGKSYIQDNEHFLEPLELPSGNAADTQIKKLTSNNFVANSHTDSLTITKQYTFMLDLDNDLIKGWFEYARYGKQDYITPNIVYTVDEIISIWGNVSRYSNNCKIIDSIDIENTESDTMTITIPFQLQGEND